jgi:hypothetical protein
VSRERVFASRFGLSKSSDNTAALQKAVDEAAARGADLQLPPGTLPVEGGPITITSSLSVIGNQTTIDKTADKEEAVFQPNGAEEVRFRGIEIDGPGKEPEGDPPRQRQLGIQVIDCGRIYVERCTFRNLPTGIIANGVDSMNVVRCHFEDMFTGATDDGERGWGVLFSGTTGAGKFANNGHVYACTFVNVPRHCIYFSDKVSGGSVYGCKIQYDKTYDGGAANEPSEPREAIQVNTGSSSGENKGVTLQRNWIDYRGAEGTFNGAIRLFRIQGSELYHHRVADNHILGGQIKVVGKHHQIDGNHIKDSPEHGVALGAGAENCRVTGNFIIGPAQQGIRTENTEDTLISENVIQSTGGIGINTQNSGGEEGVITDNHVIEAGDDGIRVASRVKTTITDNFIREPNDHGIRADFSSDGSTIQGNTVVGANQSELDYSSIIVDDSEDVTVTNNRVRHGSRFRTEVVGIDTGNDEIEVEADITSELSSGDTIRLNNHPTHSGKHDLNGSPSLSGGNTLLPVGTDLTDGTAQGNVSDPDAPLYGVRIESGASNCVVTNNDLRRSGVRFPFFDDSGDTLKNPQNQLDQNQVLDAGGFPLTTKISDQPDQFGKVGDVLLGFGRRLTKTAGDTGQEENWRLATLPASGSDTGDLIVVELTGGQFASDEHIQQSIRFANKNGFEAYTDYHFGKWLEETNSAHITAYEQPDGSVDIFLTLPADNYKGGSVVVREGSGVIRERPTVYKNPEDAGTTPPGTKVFSSLDESPQFVVDNARNIGIGGVPEPNFSADVKGGARWRDSGSEPTGNGELRRDGPDVKVYSGGEVVNLSTVVDGSTPTTFSASVAIDDTLIFADQGADPSSNGEMQRDGADVKVYSGGEVRNLSETVDTGTPTTFEEGVTINDTAGLTVQDGSGSDRAVVQAVGGDGIFSLYDDNGNNWVSLANGLSDFIDSDALAVGQSSAGDATLDVNGALKVGSEELPDAAGMIRWTGSDFEGYDGSSWVSLT